MILVMDSSVQADNSVGPLSGGREDIRVQIDFDPSLSGTVELFSRIDPALDWVSLGTYTADALVSVAFNGYFRAAATSLSGGGRVRVGIAA